MVLLTTPEVFVYFLQFFSIPYVKIVQKTVKRTSTKIEDKIAVFDLAATAKVTPRGRICHTSTKGMPTDCGRFSYIETSIVKFVLAYLGFVPPLRIKRSKPKFEMTASEIITSVK